MTDVDRSDLTLGFVPLAEIAEQVISISELLTKN